MRMRLSLLGTMIGCATMARAADEYPAWTYSRDLTIDASPAGANLTTDLAGFPLAVSLGSESSELFAQAKPDGSDLRFAAEDGSHLAYQIETWDAAAKRALVWVRLPAVKAAMIQHVKAYWGRASASDSSAGANVFRSQEGFQGVWHMATLADASANALTAQDSGTAADAGGRLGPARAFPNTDAYVVKGAYLSLGNPAALNLKGVITLEAWVKWARSDGHRIIVCHGAAPGTQPESQYETVLRIGEKADYRAGTWTGKAHYAMANVAAADSGVWIHLAGVFDGTGWTLYRNGARFASLASDTNGAKPSPGNWRIGAEYASTGVAATTGVTRYFSGSLDEVRINSVARSEDWFRLAYATQKDGQTVVKWAGPTGVFRTSPARLRSPGARKAGIWASPKSGANGYIDALGAKLPPGRERE